jgi:hypothetical protein
VPKRTFAVMGALDAAAGVMQANCVPFFSRRLPSRRSCLVSNRRQPV